MSVTTPGTMKSFSLEKEMLESQLRKLQIENTRLQNENNILQNKHKRAQSHVTYLEEQILRTEQDEKCGIHTEMAVSSDPVVHQQIWNLRNQLDDFKTQNAALEMQLRSAKLTLASGRSDGDTFKMVEGFIKETSALKDELAKAKEVIGEGDRHHQMEVNKNKELATELLKLTELKTVLQQEVHGSGFDCVAEKQVRSLSERLKVTELRLHRERADRAAKLSEVEEKLLKENARLQVSEKELLSQLNREKQKHRNVELKMKEYRDQVEKLQVSLSTKTNIVNNKQVKSGAGSKKQKEDLNMVMDELKRELNLSSGQESEMIWLLWQLKEDQGRQLKEFELGLDVLKVDHGNINKGLKALREEKELYEERLEHHKNTMEDLKKEREDLSNVYKQQVKELTDAKHANHIQAKNMEDLAAALTAENEALKSALLSGSNCASDMRNGMEEAKLVGLQHELQLTQSELSKHQRTVKLLQSQVASSKAQLAAKDQTLPGLLEALQNMGSEKVMERTNAQLTYKGTRVDQVDSTLSRGSGYEEINVHESEDEVFNLTVARKEREKELRKVQDDLNVQQSLVCEKDREKANPGLKDAALKAKEENSDPQDAVTSDENKNQPVTQPESEVKPDSVPNSKETLLTLSHFAKPKPPENPPKLPSPKVEEKPVEKAVKKDPFFSLGVLARLGFGRKKAETTSKEELPETETENKETEAARKEEKQTNSEEGKNPEKEEVCPDGEGGASEANVKEESAPSKEVKSSFFGISLLARFQSSKKEAERKESVEESPQEAEPSEETGKEDTDNSKESIDSNEHKKGDVADEKNNTTSEDVKDTREKQPEGTENKADTATPVDSITRGTDDSVKKADASGNNSPPAETPNPKKDTIFRVGLLARLGFGRKNPETNKSTSSGKENAESASGKSKEKDSPTPSEDVTKNDAESVGEKFDKKGRSTPSDEVTKDNTESVSEKSDQKGSSASSDDITKPEVGTQNDSQTIHPQKTDAVTLTDNPTSGVKDQGTPIELPNTDDSDSVLKQSLDCSEVKDDTNSLHVVAPVLEDKTSPGLAERTNPLYEGEGTPSNSLITSDGRHFGKTTDSKKRDIEKPVKSLLVGSDTPNPTIEGNVSVSAVYGKESNAPTSSVDGETSLPYPAQNITKAVDENLLNAVNESEENPRTSASEDGPSESDGYRPDLLKDSEVTIHSPVGNTVSPTRDITPSGPPDSSKKHSIESIPVASEQEATHAVRSTDSSQNKPDNPNSLAEDSNPHSLTGEKIVSGLSKTIWIEHADPKQVEDNITPSDPKEASCAYPLSNLTGANAKEYSTNIANLPVKDDISTSIMERKGSQAVTVDQTNCGRTSSIPDENKKVNKQIDDNQTKSEESLVKDVDSDSRVNHNPENINLSVVNATDNQSPDHQEMEYPEYNQKGSTSSDKGTRSKGESLEAFLKTEALPHQSDTSSNCVADTNEPPPQNGKTAVTPAVVESKKGNPNKHSGDKDTKYMEKAVMDQKPEQEMIMVDGNHPELDTATKEAATHSSRHANSVNGPADVGANSEDIKLRSPVEEQNLPDGSSSKDQKAPAGASMPVSVPHGTNNPTGQNEPFVSGNSDYSEKSDASTRPKQITGANKSLATPAHDDQLANDVTQLHNRIHNHEISVNPQSHVVAVEANESHDMALSQKEDYDVQSNDSETAAGVNTVVHNRAKDDDSWPSGEEGLTSEEIKERREIMDEVHRLLSLEDEKDLQKEAAWIRYRNKGLVELDSSVSLSDIEEVDEYGDTDVDVASLDSEEMRHETLINEQTSSGSPDLGFASPRSQYDPGSQHQPPTQGRKGEGDDSLAHDSLYSTSMPTSAVALQTSHPVLTIKPALSDGERPISEQLDQLQLDLQRKSRSLDHIHHLDAEQSLVIQTLQENLAAVNTELDDKNKQLKMKESYLESEQKKVQQLRKDVKDRDDLLSENIAKVLNEGKLTSPLVNYKRDTPKDSLSSMDAKARLLEYERNTAQSDVKRAQESMEKIAVENTELLGRLRNMRQDLVKERATVCQLTSDKVEAEQKLRICAEERNNASREKQRLEQRLARHEATTMKTVQRLEAEHQRSSEDNRQKYHSLDTEGRKMAMELATAQRLLEAREKEIELLKTNVEHKSQEISNLERQLTIVREEHQATRQEMDNMSVQLSHKMKEEASTAEVNSSLSSNKLRLELEKAQLQKDHERLSQNLDHKVRDIEDLFRKHEKTETAQKQAEAQVHQSETKILGLEMEAKHANNKMAMLEEERNDLRKQVADLRTDLLSLNTDNTSLQNELHEKKSSLSEEKLNQGQILEKLSSTSHQVELVKRDYDIISASLDHERRTIQNLQDSLKIEEDKNVQLEAKMTALHHDLQSAIRQLTESRDVADQFKKEKQILYEDVQDLCSKLSEKDNMISELQDKCDSTVENIQKDLTSEKSLIQQQRENLGQELSRTRQELENAKDKLRHKDLQLQAYVHTNRHLEEETMHRKEAEKMFDKVEDELLDNKRQVSQLSLENKRLTDENGHLMEMNEKMQKNLGQLKNQLVQQREELLSEKQEQQHEHSKQLGDIHCRQGDLEEKFNRAETELKLSKSSLSSALEAKNSLQAENQNQERTIEKLKAQLLEEATFKNHADKEVIDKLAQIAELKNTNRDLEDQLANAQNQLLRTEANLKAEQEHYKKLRQDLKNAKSSSTSHEAQVQALYLKIAELEGEIARLIGQAETVRQNLEGKNKRLALELKQVMETHDKERTKLIHQAQQLSQDLENAREEGAHKGRDNLGLQEDMMNSDAKVRDLTTDLTRVTDELKKERDLRKNLEQNNHMLQMELIRVRPQVEGEHDPSSESARLEVNKMMSDMSRSMQQQLEAQKSADKETRYKELKSLEDFKKKIAQMESTLSQEQAMHVITKTQLDALNEDNARLRHQLQVARKKNQVTSLEDRSKSRMDEINELINRSQSRAQQMLASSAYNSAQSPHSIADPLHIVTASRDFGAYSSVPVMMMTSPLSRSMMSDEILHASSPHDPVRPK